MDELLFGVSADNFYAALSNYCSRERVNLSPAEIGDLCNSGLRVSGRANYTLTEYNKSTFYEDYINEYLRTNAYYKFDASHINVGLVAGQMQATGRAEIKRECRKDISVDTYLVSHLKEYYFEEAKVRGLQTAAETGSLAMCSVDALNQFEEENFALVKEICDQALQSAEDDATELRQKNAIKNIILVFKLDFDMILTFQIMLI
ncbi:hypothetical protein MBANPS3_002003 [Mucor bainieri]